MSLWKMKYCIRKIENHPCSKPHPKCTNNFAKDPENSINQGIGVT